MQLSELFLGLGEENFYGVLRTISMGKLKTYHLYDRLKTRTHMQKLNTETLRKAGPRLWARMGEKDENYATDLSQAILISHLEMIVEILNVLGIPHDEGFFPKDADVSPYLTDGWKERIWGQFSEKYSKPALRFYVNHLAWEVMKSEEVFLPA